MSSFDFSLQRVLDLRAHERLEAEKALARAQQRRRELEQTIDRLEQEVRGSLQSFAASDMNPTSLRRLEAHRESSRDKRRQLFERLKKLEEEEQQAKRELIEKRRSEETIQSLEETERRDYAEREAKRRQNMLDEQAISQHLRQNPIER